MKRGIVAGTVGGALGLAAGVTAIALAVDRRSAARKQVDLAQRFGALPADRTGTVGTEDGVDLYYEEVGPAGAPLTAVFVPGFALSLGAYHFQRQALAERFGSRLRMFFFDQRSHGRSAWGDPARDTIDQLGRDLRIVLDALVPDGPVVLVGHSMGGMTILALADAHPELFGPDRIAGVALLSTSAGNLAGVTLGLPALIAKLRGPLLPLLLRSARRQANLVERGRALGADLAWVITRRLGFAADDIDPAVVEYVTSMIAGTRIEVVADFYPTLMAHDKFAALPALAGVRVLIVCGDKDLLTPVEHSRAIAAQLPGAELVVVPQGGHVALLEHPEAFDDALAGLVDAVLADIRDDLGKMRTFLRNQPRSSREGGGR